LTNKDGDLKRVVAVAREGFVQMYSRPSVTKAGTFSGTSQLYITENIKINVL
jgi:hypothetical protein